MNRRTAAAVLLLCLAFLALTVTTMATGSPDPVRPAGHVRASLMSGDFAHTHFI